MRLLSSAGVWEAGAPPYTLYDIPVSNNGARVRMVLYYKQVGPEEVTIVSPGELGGLQAADYLAVNPQGKMPALSCRDEGYSIPESDTIARFLGGKYAANAPKGDFAPEAGTDVAVRADRIARHHDLYMVPIQACMYREPVNSFMGLGSRRDALAEFQRQVDVLEAYVGDDGPYMVGPEPTQADVACFPTLIFAEKMLPMFQDTPGFKLGPKLTKWWEFMTSGQDEVATKVYAEIRDALDGWEAKGRWETLLGAGLRDTAEATIFDKILDGSVPADVVYQDDYCLAFKDIAPAAPTHILLIPKHRDTLTRLSNANNDHHFILGHLLKTVPKIAKEAGLDDYRLVVNDGEQAGQTVFHLHLHILGGRDLAWPPG